MSLSISRVRPASEALTEDSPAKRVKLHEPRFQDPAAASLCVTTFPSKKGLVMYEGEKLNLTKANFAAWATRKGIVVYDEVNTFALQVLDRWEKYSTKVTPQELRVYVVKTCSDCTAQVAKLKQVCKRRFFLLTTGWKGIARQLLPLSSALDSTLADQQKPLSESQVEKVRAILKRAGEELKLLEKILANMEDRDDVYSFVELQTPKFHDAVYKKEQTGPLLLTKQDQMKIKQKGKELSIWDPGHSTYMRMPKAKPEKDTPEAREKAKAIDLKSIKTACDLHSDIYNVLRINQIYLRQMRAAITSACETYRELSSGLALEE